MKKPNKKINKVFIPYLVIVSLSVSILCILLRIDKANIYVPFSYSTDGILSNSFIKQIIDNKWIFHNDYLGAPFGQNMYDFPTSDSLNFFIIKIISLFSHNYAFILNLFYLISYPLTAISCMYVFRKLNINYIVSIFGSLIYTFLPYHFMRGEAHLFLSSYYLIPLICLVIIWICVGHFRLFSYNFRTKKIEFFIQKYELVFSVIVCSLVSSAGIYYAFFACFFLIIAGISSSINFKNIGNFITSTLLIIIISCGILINISPNIIFYHKNGINNESAKRSPAEAEIYGMKITQLLLPVSGHRINSISNDKYLYNIKEPLVNENDMASLGSIGSCGFIITIFIILFLKNNKNILYNSLGLLNISSVLLATIGGFSSLFALIISPQIRAYNRISIYIAFFSILMFCLLLNNLVSFHRNKIIRSCLFFLFIMILLVAGLLDQTSRNFIPPYDSNSAEFIMDDNFVKRIENSVPKGSMIFQLPYVPYPENPPVNKMSDYELLKGYLHSKTLKWSYGGMKGRKGDLWQQYITKKPIGEFVESISIAGFNGIYVDTYGYDDVSNKKLEQELSKIIKVDPIRSENGRLLFYNLDEYSKDLKMTLSENELAIRREKIMHPIIISWEKGFSDLEGNQKDSWRWCSESGDLVINNTSEKVKKVNISMSICTGYDELSDLKVRGLGINLNNKVDSKGYNLTRTVILPPGKSIVNFNCNAKKVNASGDPRVLVFRITDFHIEEIE